MTTTSARKSLLAIKVWDAKKEMKPTQELHNMGQSLWLDNITRGLLTSGTLRCYRDDFSITGLTQIRPSSITQSRTQILMMRPSVRNGMRASQLRTSSSSLRFEDLPQASDLFRPIYDATGGIDGWVSLEVSPLLKPRQYVVIPESDVVRHEIVALLP